MGRDSDQDRDPDSKQGLKQGSNEHADLHVDAGPGPAWAIRLFRKGLEG